MDQREVLHDLLHLLELKQRREAALTWWRGREEREGSDTGGEEESGESESEGRVTHCSDPRRGR